MNRSLSIALAAAVLAAAGGCARQEKVDASAPAMAAEPRAGDAERPVTDSRVRSVMQEKLVHAHALLDAIVLENFDRIEHHARKLTRLSERSEWYMHETEQYLELSREFREITERLAQRAGEKDLPAVSHQQVQMMSSCMKCHAYLRREGLVRELPGVISLAPPRRPSSMPVPSS